MGKVINSYGGKGGSFTIENTNLENVLIPEEFTEEQKMIMKTTKEFVEKEVTVLGEKAQQLNYQLSKDLVKKAGDVGLLGVCLPEEYGGLGLDGIRFAMIKESLNLGPSSMTATIGGQMGIGMLPIIFFGTAAQREKYLPALQEGTITTSFALTESQSGTDASSIKTSATLTEDGKHYILNGNKVFITNAGFADIFVVFAKINGTGFSAFIVERETEGLSIGPEEKKMGLKASSTCSMTFEDVKVPVENLLGKPGEGHRFAFNTLNFGRLSVGAGCLGNSKHALEVSVKYANQRVQFGKKISSFPLISQKLANINIKTYVLESMVYRTAGIFDEKLKEINFSDPNLEENSRKAIGEYMIECAINKVFGSETLDYAADEGVQIHGGYGYIQEYEIESIYRDSRIKRIFEGTNEMNRMFITKTLVKKLSKGQLPELQVALEDSEESLQNSLTTIAFNQTLDQETYLLSVTKKIYHMALAQALKTYDKGLEDEQEVLSDLGDIVIQTYAMESALLRAKKLVELNGEEKSANAIDMTVAFIHEAFDQIIGFAKNTLYTTSSGDTLDWQLNLLQESSRKAPINPVVLKRKVAKKVIEVESYSV
ncbi:acyl-CoA dehydrogenase family protein [Alkalihalobacillus deserti]|uniref:acyl-CoA dehydrogenase family protein n=1 Tax=Alkalihalobacillus deserti TaxID=2879466 RepID=UPI001D135E78|nr:acyl-CoA dehydrogenase family protein [Alkalihalobacillus deserti]